MKTKHHCLFCNTTLKHMFVDLGTCPPSNAFLTAEQCEGPEVFYPLRAYVCEKCFLVQSPFFKRPQEIFNYDYAYHSSWSPSWVEHAKQYIDATCERFDLDENSLIVEIGSNDGYMLQHALARKVPCLGIDPSSGAASIAQTKGIPTITDFFTEALARTLVAQGKQADLVCGINVFAHVPNINDFIGGMRALLKPQGIVTMEFPHLLRLVEDVQFDTIYHEHYFYYTLHIVQKMLNAHGLRIFDVVQLPTHGGSLRIYGCQIDADHIEQPAVQEILDLENSHNMQKLEYYSGFQQRIASIRKKIIHFLLQTSSEGKTVMGYGAAAKGNTMINYFGIRKDLLPCVVDASPIKQGKFLPGSRIPVYAPSQIKKQKPDYLLILPWNLKNEIVEQHKYICEWGGRFVTIIPHFEIL